MGQNDDGKARILIAERDRNVRELQLVFLSNAGFTVEFADDGQSAIAGNGMQNAMSYLSDKLDRRVRPRRQQG